MSFTPHEREALLSARFVGPTVVQRLEEIGFGDMSSLAAALQSPMPSQWHANS